MKSLKVRPQWFFYLSTEVCQLPGRILDVSMIVGIQANKETIRDQKVFPPLIGVLVYFPVEIRR